MPEIAHKYARVLVNISTRALNRPFTYAIPAELTGLVAIGAIVEAPFRSGSLVGFVVSLENELSPDALGHEIKPLTRVLDEEPYWGTELMELSRFMAHYYGCLWLECLQAIVPAPVLKKAVQLLKAKRPRVASKPELRLAASVPAYAAHKLNAQQEEAVAAIGDSCCGGPPVLLYGVTGSGKTEVYLQSVARCLQRGRQAVVLVPELSLTHQAIQRYRGRLGETVGVLNSALSDTERQAYWWAMNRGELSVALGTRSAVFAPLHNIGLFVIDEEHESSYKQENSPRYHARQVAFKRAQVSKAGIVFGSATPSIESFYLALQGRYRLVQMTERPQGHALPSIHLVDMRRRGKRSTMISAPLLEAMRDHFASGHQVVLFLNRRGFSKFLQCRDCGFLLGCQHCSIPLTYHKGEGQLRCHYCGFVQPLPDCCPQCQGLEFRHGGGGTERLVKEVEALFPGIGIARMDRDTTGKVGAHERILEEFASGKAQILLGTKMITKGLDYPNVTLVGVINGDDELNMPDFRASEHCFQMLTQVAGRAGRGDFPGEVFIQAFNPEQLAVQAALSGDYRSLYDNEIELRRQLSYPPFCRLVRSVVSGSDAALTAIQASALGDFLRRRRFPGEILGPAPCPIERLQGRYRYQVVLKCASTQQAVALLEEYLAVQKKRHSEVSFTIDPEPQSLN